MALAHEARARKAGIVYDLIDLREVYAKTNGVCGICGLAVSFDEFAVDHIDPVSKGGPHLLWNLQPAHKACNSRKGNN